MNSQYPRNVLAIHAHPDDAEIFCAGTLALLKKKGFNITIATMTAGGLGGVNSTESLTIIDREREAKLAATELGANYFCMGGRDGYLYDTAELRMKTLSLIRQTNAGIIVTHLPFDYHPDHRVCSQIVEAAAMITTLANAPVNEKPLANTPLLYHSAPLGGTDPLGEAIVTPHFYIDITTVMDQKMKMLECHKTQQQLMKVMHKMDDFYGEMKKANASYGAYCQVPFAEAFWQHLGGGFQKEDLVQGELAEYIKWHTGFSNEM